MTTTEKAKALTQIAHLMLDNQHHYSELKIMANTLMIHVEITTRADEFNVKPKPYENYPHNFEVHAPAGADGRVYQWSERYSMGMPDDPDNVPTVDETLLSIRWTTGAYSMHSDYPIKSFHQFFSECIEQFKPAYIDSSNKQLLFKAPEARVFMANVDKVWQRYKSSVTQEIKEKKIAELQSKIDKISGE